MFDPLNLHSKVPMKMLKTDTEAHVRSFLLHKFNKNYAKIERMFAY